VLIGTFLSSAVCGGQVSCEDIEAVHRIEVDDGGPVAAPQDPHIYVDSMADAAHSRPRMVVFLRQER